MKKQVLALIAASALVVSANAVAGDAAAGKAKSATCVACHGARRYEQNTYLPESERSERSLPG